jgi:hypothetical protein
MKYVAALVVGFALLGCQIGFGEEVPIPISLSHAIEMPQKFNQKLITVEGFLVIWTQPGHAPLVTLYLDQKSANDSPTKNGILVIPSDEMLQSHERIDRKYVRLVGTFRAVPGPHGSYGPQIRDIKKCTVLDDPASQPEPAPNAQQDRSP